MILLNPGPANTTMGVKLAQIVDDICPREIEFGQIMQDVSSGLLKFVQGSSKARAVLFGGSGTLAIESCLSSVVGSEDKIVIIVNGAYGKRMFDIAKAHEKNVIAFESDFLSPIDFMQLKVFLESQKPQFVGVVHSETTSGLLNDLKQLSFICKPLGIKIISDCMSSFACYPLNLNEIDYIVASSNKNLQGMAGVSFVVANVDNLKKASHSRSVYLDLKAQDEYFTRTQQMRFTPPVQILYALKKAIEELCIETLEGRYLRYKKNNSILRKGLLGLGLEIFPKESFGVIITAIKMPKDIDFKTLHDTCKKQGYTIYPGKIEGLEMFRIANIGEIYPYHIEGFLNILRQFLQNLVGENA
ncbi:aminotransferase class V-fold PLP-dependent enzyme [Helicobacter monodelphidis]|uniref:aminotransferase class V-fold PLP-dependent enzyme n=1 Tax=Helicobacter sp. 15-1451 TaxID=2004995 RepID=UPI00215D4D25|nr:aminotransferase class V-fold PLP-dependent enzyme [Helicobacter sp. 15-1451]